MWLKKISFHTLTKALTLSQINSKMCIMGEKLMEAKDCRHQDALLFRTWIEPHSHKSCCFCAVAQ